MSFVRDERGVLRFTPWERHDWLRHGFSSRATGDFRERSPAAAAQAFGETLALVTVRQTHSTIVRRAEEALRARPERLEGDALIGACPDVLLGVRTADCAPILVVDPVRRAVAAIHAGWRGAAERIVVRAVEAMQSELGCDPAHLEAVIGPCIGRERYEVGEEVAERFDPAAIVRRPGAPRPFLDLVEANRRQLEACGLAAANIASADHCTYADESYFSHRREDARAGRMLSIIGQTSG